jgi:hypothetical protein
MSIAVAAGAVVTMAVASGANLAGAAEQDWVERAVHNFGEPINTMWAEGELSFADDGTMVYCSAREDLAVAPGDPKSVYRHVQPGHRQLEYTGKHGYPGERGAGDGYRPVTARR